MLGQPKLSDYLEVLVNLRWFREAILVWVPIELISLTRLKFLKS